MSYDELNRQVNHSIEVAYSEMTKLGVQSTIVTAFDKSNPQVAVMIIIDKPGYAAVLAHKFTHALADLNTAMAKAIGHPTYPGGSFEPAPPVNPNLRSN